MQETSAAQVVILPDGFLEEWCDVWCVVQAHESPVRSMQYAHNENWLLTGEDDGKLKYWKPNLECVKVSLVQPSAVWNMQSHYMQSQYMQSQ